MHEATTSRCWHESLRQVLGRRQRRVFALGISMRTSVFACAKNAIDCRASSDSPRAAAAPVKFDGSLSSDQRISMSPMLQVMASSDGVTGVHSCPSSPHPAASAAHPGRHAGTAG